LGPAEALGLRYADGLEVLTASSSARAMPGEPVGLALSWVVHGSPYMDLVWDVSLLDRNGREVARGTGIRHGVDSITPGEVVVSWFTLGIPSEALLGAYRLRVRRFDQPDGRAMPLVSADGQTALEWSSRPIDVFRG
jgi:hypothetical protein